MSQSIGLWRALSCGALVLGALVSAALVSAVRAEAPEFRELLRRSVEQRRPNLPQADCPA